MTLNSVEKVYLSYHIISSVLNRMYTDMIIKLHLVLSKDIYVVYIKHFLYVNHASVV